MPKLGAETFLYLNPEPNTPDFAQCGTCRDWITGDDRCVIHGRHVSVTESMSCGFYIYGAPKPAGTHALAIVTPEESGLTNREVRCENCIHFEKAAGEYGDECGFFRKLNMELPELFEIDINVEPKGCCNAQTSE